ncbi:MAG: hypothetical protein LQ351_007556 [Letrouitia transgressa]|nr:MAG: hypothetical protein LQ351_007556 [Letrouitia transgressa]
MAPESSRICFSNNSGGTPLSDISYVDRHQKEHNAVTINPRNSTLNTHIADSSVDQTPLQQTVLQLASTTKKLWNSGRELKVQFKAGTPWQQEKVKTYAPYWSKWANIKFNFESTSSPDILIDFNPTLGSWSVLGTDSVYPIGRGQPSMNLGWIIDTKTEADIRQVVLHEFGHALGAVHEHTSPFANIPWNKEQVYKDLGGNPNFWPRETVDKNMFQVYNALEVPSTAFDIASIMLYQYPKPWLLTGEGTPYNTHISELDKAFVAFCYPKDEYDAAQFHTLEKISQEILGPSIESIKYFYKGFESAPTLLYGLYWLDLEAGADIYVRASPQDIGRDHFIARIEALGGAKLKAAGMTWLEVPRFPFLQTGVFDTKEVHPWSQPRANTTKRINFEKRFSNPPRVVCFFTSLNIADGHDWRAKVFPSLIDEAGFTINISTWSDTMLYAGEAAWLAHPFDQPKVTSGRFSTAEAELGTAPRASVSKVKRFDVHFDKVPKVFLALDELHYEHGKDLKCNVSLSSATPDAMTWNLQAGANSAMHSSGASFFVWEEAL